MIYQIENFSYDHAQGVINQNNEEYKLTKTQRKLLKYFLDNPREIITKQTLMQEVWGRIVTENSVDQVISILRGYIEVDPSKPNIIITHFGQGISFEAQVNFQNKNNKNNTDTSIKKNINKMLPLVFILILVVIGLLYIYLPNPSNKQDKSNNNQQILILPMVFKGDSISLIEQQGMKALLQSTFNNLETEGEMVFDETSLTTQQAIEKHWSLESDLVVMRLNVVKNGDIYEAIIELSQGANGLKKTTVTANNINDILNKQIMFISDYHKSITNIDLDGVKGLTPNNQLIEALGYKKSGQYQKSIDLLKQVLISNENNFKARLALAEVYINLKDYNQSLAQLNTLKATSAYSLIGTEIELNLAKIKYSKHEYEDLIETLKAYQANNFNISLIKKAKIKLQIGKAYLANGDTENALKFYLQSIINIDEQLNPIIYARSYYGQGKVLLPTSVGQKVYDLFEKSLAYARAAADIHQQALALNEMSFISLSGYDWENAIDLKKQALELLELDNDKSEVASGLGTLVGMLNLRGQFTEAKQVNARLGDIAKQLDSDALLLHFLHYDAIIAMNVFDWSHADHQIKVQMQLAIKSNNYAMQLNNAFLALELLLLKKDISHFKQEWDQRAALIKELGFERFQVYMDLYLARYYKQLGNDNDAINLLTLVSKQAIDGKDIKILVDAQNQLAEVTLKTNPQKSLDILNELEKHNPHPNPYLDLKAQALNKLGKNIEALSVLNQAKLVYHESWTSEHQALLELIQSAVNKN